MSPGGRDSVLACQCLRQSLAQLGCFINICVKTVGKAYTILPHTGPRASLCLHPSRCSGITTYFPRHLFYL